MRTPNKRSRETVRKLVHIFYGLLVVFSLGIAGKLAVCVALAAVLAAGLLLSELVLMKVRVPFIYEILEVCDRDYHIRIRPGFGPLRFTLGALVTTVIFSERTASASLLLLTFVDAAAAVVGMNFGKTRIPWSSRKTFEGSAAGFVAGTIVASAVLPFRIAAIAAAVAAFVESFDFDDNVTLPVSAGVAIKMAEAVFRV